MIILFNEEPVIEEAENLYQTFNANDEYRLRYEAAQKWERDQKMIQDTLKEQGHQEGRKEALLETAKNLKTAGASFDLIEKSTGLTRREIEDI